jgi:hypothetical protein
VTGRRDSYPLLRFLALAAVLVAVGYAAAGVGWCISWVDHPAAWLSSR